jgi:protocatechuate 3,4-dioxygenase beta subunit
MKTDLSRRNFLIALVPATAALSACCETVTRGPRPASSAPPQRIASSAPVATPVPDAARSCLVTETNIEGPYYRAGAPFRSQLRDAATLGVPLVLGGRVLSLDCRSALDNALIEIWQADGSGHYDNDGSRPMAHDEFRLRGKHATGDGGIFRFDTVVPGHYLNGRSYRPAHIHVKVSAPGHTPLTTQLYFPGDPYNDSDPFIRRSLLVDLASGPRGPEARYDFVLSPLS